MLFHIIYLYRTEGSQTYMKGHVGNVNPFFLYFFQKLLCEMQTCSRCCGRAFVFGIYGLITVLVFQFMGDIRRQRHLAQLIQDLLKDSLIVELDQSVTFIYHIQDLALQNPISESDLCSRAGLFARLDQTLPDIIFPSLQEKDLNKCPCFLLMSV